MPYAQSCRLILFTTRSEGLVSHIKKEPKYKQRSEACRKKYLAEIARIDPKKLVYVDETGADNNLVPLRGWAPVGERAYAEQIAFKTERLSTIAAYRRDSKEIIAPFEYQGYTDLSLFTGWFDQILCPHLQPGDYVILDNASFHKSDELFDIAKSHKVNIFYLPAYSPDLNPIEKVWANFKRNIRKVIKKCKTFQEALTIAFNETISC